MPILPPVRTSAAGFAPHLLAAGSNARRQRMGLQLGNIQTLRDKRDRMLAMLGRIRQERAAKKAQEAAEPAFGGMGGPAGAGIGALLGAPLGPAGMLAGAQIGGGVGGGVEASLSGDPQALGRSLQSFGDRFDEEDSIFSAGATEQAIELFEPSAQQVAAFRALPPTNTY